MNENDIETNGISHDGRNWEYSIGRAQISFFSFPICVPDSFSLQGEGKKRADRHRTAERQCFDCTSETEAETVNVTG
jgi:hypothetical protein